MPSSHLRLACVVLVALLAAGSVVAAPEDARVGAIRAIVAREGTALREGPSVLSKVLTTVPHGTRVRVEERREAWIRVATVPAAGATAAGGWLRASQTVEPFALTQGGQRGVIAQVGAQPSQADLQAAGRQFDAATEEGYRREHPDLAPYFPLVDEVERSGPSAEEVERFVLEGRLGRPARRAP